MQPLNSQSSAPRPAPLSMDSSRLKDADATAAQQPSFPRVTADATLPTPAAGKPPNNPAWQASYMRESQEVSAPV